jgi:hypothetical protein
MTFFGGRDNASHVVLVGAHDFEDAPVTGAGVVAAT